MQGAEFYFPRPGYKQQQKIVLLDCTDSRPVNFQHQAYPLKRKTKQTKTHHSSWVDNSAAEELHKQGDKIRNSVNFG